MLEYLVREGYKSFVGENIEGVIRRTMADTVSGFSSLIPHAIVPPELAQPQYITPFCDFLNTLGRL